MYGSYSLCYLLDNYLEKNQSTRGKKHAPRLVRGSNEKANLNGLLQSFIRSAIRCHERTFFRRSFSDPILLKDPRIKPVCSVHSRSKSNLSPVTTEPENFLIRPSCRWSFWLSAAFIPPLVKAITSIY